MDGVSFEMPIRPRPHAPVQTQTRQQPHYRQAVAPPAQYTASTTSQSAQQVAPPVSLAMQAEAVASSTPRKSRGLFMGVRNWQEFRIFAAGSLFAVALLSMGYYFGISRPLGSAEGPVAGGGTVVVTTPDGTEVEVDAGVNGADVDSSPPVPVVGNVPKTLKIPSIRVNAPIRSLGMTSSGALAVPNYLWQVGWYDQSAKPGQSGTVVLDGHYNGPDYAVFRDLNKLEVGSEIIVENGDGELFRYAVESKETYDSASVPMDRLVGSDGAERLNIITCNGTWQPAGRTFDKRMVIYAKRVP